jgi:uncharacterized membrane protein YfcA
MRFPVYIATATSTFTLVFTSGVAVLVHVVQGHYAGVVGEEASLSLGVLVGAQLGALASLRLAKHQDLVTRLLSLALILIALRLLGGALL